MTMTYGQQAVASHSADKTAVELMRRVRGLYAEIIDILADGRARTNGGEKFRHFSIAITDAETAQMRAVKAITWTDEETE